MDPVVITELLKAGPLGILILYLVWDRNEARKEREEARRERLAYDQAHLVYDQARLEGDKVMSAALAALTTAVLKGNDHV